MQQSVYEASEPQHRGVRNKVVPAEAADYSLASPVDANRTPAKDFPEARIPRTLERFGPA
jgi:hypothetical protein